MEMGMDPAMALSIAKAESNFCHERRSKYGISCRSKACSYAHHIAFCYSAVNKLIREFFLELGIQVLDEFDGVEIFLSAVHVRDPLAVVLSIVKIEHGSHRIHTQTIYVVSLNPVDGTADQEVFDLIFAIVKYPFCVTVQLAAAGQLAFL